MRSKIVCKARANKNVVWHGLRSTSPEPDHVKDCAAGNNGNYEMKENDGKK